MVAWAHGRLAGLNRRLGGALGHQALVIDLLGILLSRSCAALVASSSSAYARFAFDGREIGLGLIERVYGRRRFCPS